MTREEIIQALRCCGHSNPETTCFDCPVHKKYSGTYCYKMLLEAANLLEAQGREEKNDPLTLEELREMDGKGDMDGLEEGSGGRTEAV